MLKAEFYNCQEIRMGSPFNICDLRLLGSWQPDISEYEWQDRAAYTPDQLLMALIAWDTTGNEPGFRVILLDSVKQQVSATERLEGCCQSLEWNNGSFTWTAFRHPRTGMHVSRGDVRPENYDG